MRYFSLLLLLCIPSIAAAQVHRTYTRPEPVWEFMVQGGLQYTTFAKSGYEASYKPGWHAGLALKIPVINALWVHPGIFYSKRSAVLQYPAQGAAEAYTVTHTFTYVSYPILLAYRPNDLFEFHIGPQFGVLLGNESTSTDPQLGARLSPSEFNKWEYAAAAGIELNVSPLVFGLRYAYSLRQLANTQLSSSQLGEAQLHGLQLYGALVF